MIRLGVILLLLFGALPCAVAQPMPVNPEVTQDTIASTICVPRWTRGVRPGTWFTNKLKRALMAEAGLPWWRALEFELDHRLPLTLGGAPRDPANLMLQSWKARPHRFTGETDARLKDTLETRLNRAVCAGELPLDEAQRCIWTDWRACLDRFPPRKDAP